MFFANDFVHYLINLLELLRNCYQNDISAKIQLIWEIIKEKLPFWGSFLFIYTNSF
jgi:hypothetical protein